MSKVRNIRVDDATWERWQKEASQAGLSVSSLVRVRMSQVWVGPTLDFSNKYEARLGEIVPVPLEVKRIEELPVMTTLVQDKSVMTKEVPDTPQDGKTVEPKLVPKIPGVSKASDLKAKAQRDFIKKMGKK